MNLPRTTGLAVERAMGCAEKGGESSPLIESRTSGAIRWMALAVTTPWADAIPAGDSPAACWTGDGETGVTVFEYRISVSAEFRRTGL
jgi:hypothetical protein